MDAGQREQLQLAMRALAAGDRAAFKPVFSTLWPVLRVFCDRALHDSDAAHDAAQTALMKLFMHAAEFRADGDVIAWAIGFASFECLSVRTRKVRRREHVDDAGLAAVPADQLSPEDALIHADLRAAALELLGSLRPQDLEALRGAFDGEGPAASGPTVRKRRQRALERLRIAWRKANGHGD